MSRDIWRHFRLNKRDTEVNVVSDLFPIQFKCNEIDYSIDNPPQENEVLEIYEVYSSVFSEAIPKSPLTVEPTSAETRIVSSNPSPFIEKNQEWYSVLDKEIHTIEDHMKTNSKQFQKEIQCMAENFYFCWKVDETADAQNHDLLKEVTSCRDALRDITQKKSKLNDALEMNNSQNSLLDPIVYFNVEGEIFTILRSTILRAIPKSQLAVRVSGRWEEQPSKGDIDEEGNLIVNCHKESFKQILSALQISCFEDCHLIIYVNSICKDYIEETLDYLQIVPDLITTEQSF
jgi:DNA-binding transcriptional regulator GbsR (MarR family)